MNSLSLCLDKMEIGHWTDQAKKPKNQNQVECKDSVNWLGLNCSAHLKSSVLPLIC